MKKLPPLRSIRKHCMYCGIAEDRKKMDEENDKNFMEQLGKHYVCPVCSKL